MTECAGMLIFTIRTIFFFLLRKCYKITMPNSNLYVEYPYIFWQTSFFMFFHTH